MTAPHIAKKEPAGLTLEAGKTYAWCACGLSQKQPFCDGSHKPTEFKPIVFKQEKKSGSANASRARTGRSATARITASERNFRRG
jgi:CDGSH-type Zn-finger protein